MEETSVSMSELGYDEFYSSIGSIIMGGKTYRQLVNEISPDKWLYEGNPCYVYSRLLKDDNANVRFTSLPPSELLEKIRSEHSGNIWLMGGGEIISLFMKENLVDVYFVYIMPVLLGGGLKLFPEGFSETGLDFKSAGSIGDIVELIYHRT